MLFLKIIPSYKSVVELSKVLDIKLYFSKFCSILKFILSEHFQQLRGAHDIKE